VGVAGVVLRAARAERVVAGHAEVALGARDHPGPAAGKIEPDARPRVEVRADHAGLRYAERVVLRGQVGAVVGGGSHYLPPVGGIEVVREGGGVGGVAGNGVHEVDGVLLKRGGIGQGGGVKLDGSVGAPVVVGVLVGAGVCVAACRVCRGGGRQQA